MQIQLHNGRAYQVGNRLAARNQSLVLEVLGAVLTVVYETSSFVLSVRTNPNTNLTLTSSDGSSTVFNQNITKSYPNAARRSSSLDTDRNSIDIIGIDSAGTVSLNGPTGTVDFTSFPNLVAARCLDSFCNVFKINTIYSLDISRAQCAGKTLDLSQARASSIRCPSSYCNDVAWPALGTGEILLQYHAITTSQLLPYVPGLVTLYLDNNQAASAAGIGQLDVSQNPQLQSLALRQSRVNNLVVAPSSSLNSLDVTYCDFSSSYPGAPGTPASLVEVLRNSPSLNALSGYNCGLDAATIEGLLDVILATHPRTLLLGGGGRNNHYLNTGGISGRVCEPLVTQQAQQKLAAARAAGSYIELNDPVFFATQLSDTTHQLDYVSGTQDCTDWGSSDVFYCTQSFNSDLFNEGEHRIISGSGKSFVITNHTNYPGRTGDRGLVVMRKG